MRVALVHDWLTGMRGGERVLEELLVLFPDAEIFTLLHVPGAVSPAIERRPIHTSWLQHAPGAARGYRNYLPLFPAAIASLDLAGVELVISVSHAVAKGVRVPAGVPHLCYCLTPMRYVWDRYDDYFAAGRANAVVRAVMPLVASRLRAWDRRRAQGVTRFVAISEHVRERIARAYGRVAGVVYPPVALDRFAPGGAREDFYLVVSALVPAKRIDLAIDACVAAGRRLTVVGQGPEFPRLTRRARPMVTFVPDADDQTVARYYARCKALIIPGVEDFGLTAVEAQAAGAPVIAFGEGGVRESVIGVNGTTPLPKATGVFFESQTVESLVAAIGRCEATTFEREALAASVARFGVERFRREFRAEVDAL